MQTIVLHVRLLVNGSTGSMTNKKSKTNNNSTLRMFPCWKTNVTLYTLCVIELFNLFQIAIRSISFFHLNVMIFCFQFERHSFCYWKGDDDEHVIIFTFTFTRSEWNRYPKPSSSMRPFIYTNVNHQLCYWTDLIFVIFAKRLCAG